MNKTILFNDIEISKKHFYDAKKAIPLDSVNISSISPLRIILPQMSGYIKYFENGGKNMSFKIEDDKVYINYNQIWNKIKELLNEKFYSEPIYEDKYIKTTVKTFSNTLFRGDEIPKERLEYACMACTFNDSVLRVDKKNYPQGRVYR